MTRVSVAFCALAFACAAQSRQFPIPGKPVRIIVPFPPGGQTDIQARAVAQKVNETPGMSVIVENTPGASTVIGAREVQKATPDGHTLFYTIATHVQIPHLFRPAPWDAFKDFTPITAGARSATVLTAHVSVPFNDVKGLMAYAKANPGKLNFASFSPGSTSHLNGERFKRQAGIDIVHVPYKGSGDAMKDHLSGVVQLFFDGPTTALSNSRSGRVKMLAHAAETRMASVPDLPTMRESGYDVGYWGYLWFWGPAGMSAQTVDAVYQHPVKAIKHPDVVKLFADGGSEASGMPPAEMAKAARELSDRWGEVIREVGIRIDQ
ncbi:MAG: tripartite tricarboxylate transporter substrate binding protein [Burkholderiaceae bacterium]|nr:tripartite tricarboxylate transporter substrate binding protein [Burkholderiaceae bacterium]